MGAMASQITSFTIVHSTIYSGADQRKHQSSASVAGVGNSPGTGWFTAQVASNAENVSIWWRHHDWRFYVMEWYTSLAVGTFCVVSTSARGDVIFLGKYLQQTTLRTNRYIWWTKRLLNLWLIFEIGQCTFLFFKANILAVDQFYIWQNKARATYTFNETYIPVQNYNSSVVLWHRPAWHLHK